MDKIDFKKDYKELYSASEKKVSELTVPAFKYLMYSGKGSPNNNPDFADAMDSLFSVAYTLKFTLKFNAAIQPSGYIDYTVAPVQTSWCGEGGVFNPERPETWVWTCMIPQPDFITPALVKKAKEEVVRTRTKKKERIPGIEKLEFKKIAGYRAVQRMHIGPYGEVGATYKMLTDYLEEKGKKVKGSPLEIYISDPRRVAVEKLKTIVRFPV
ncbi:MAG: GyrI-like domain-containing protein [Bacteroidota bacterium]